MKKSLIPCLVVVMLITLLFKGFTQSAVASAEVIKLKAVHFLPGFMDICKDFVELTKRINSQTKGELEIKVLGGPEIFPPREMGEALRKGIIDGLMCPTEYYTPLLPEATVFHLGMLTPAEERESGFYDFMVDRHKKSGLFYVGRTRVYTPFYVYLRKKVTKLEDFAGLKIGRGAPTVSAYFKSIGATVVMVKTGEYYSAMERGVVDGVGHPSDGITGLSLNEVAKYLLDEPIYLRPSTVFVMNLEKYNNLPAKLQKIIMDTTIAFENERLDIDIARTKKELEIGKQRGMEFLHFSSEESKRFFDGAYAVEWGILEKKVPDLVPTLRKLLKE